VATAYERKHGRFSRIHHFALVHLFTPATDVYSCPLAMTDGAARALVASGNQALIARALPRLTARDPTLFWTSGQWMTESTGGSDVGRSETIARKDGDRWRLYGRKWFTSAVTSQMALTLARPEGNPGGGKGLALFFLETRDANGRLANILVHRLKDKLGTRKVPTAELTLDGTPAWAVAGEAEGVRNIAPMLNVTRTWNAVSAVSYMRRGLALARDYAKKRVVFGTPLADKPLHADTLAGLQAEYEAGFQLTFYAVELLGRDDVDCLDAGGKDLLRLLTPITKLTTGRQAVALLPRNRREFRRGRLCRGHRDSRAAARCAGILDLGRDHQRTGVGRTARTASRRRARRAAGRSGNARLGGARHAVGCLRQSGPDGAGACAELDSQASGDALEAGARRFAMTLGRALALLLLAAMRSGRSTTKKISARSMLLGASRKTEWT